MITDMQNNINIIYCIIIAVSQLQYVTTLSQFYERVFVTYAILNLHRAKLLVEYFAHNSHRPLYFMDRIAWSVQNVGNFIRVGQHHNNKKVYAKI